MANIDEAERELLKKDGLPLEKKKKGWLTRKRKGRRLVSSRSAAGKRKIKRMQKKNLHYVEERGKRGASLLRARGRRGNRVEEQQRPCSRYFEKETVSIPTMGGGHSATARRKISRRDGDEYY